MDAAVNKRTDDYGGSVDNRLRFMREVIDGVIAAVPAEKVGIRFSPNGVYGEVGSEDGVEVYTKAIEYVVSKKLGYVHVMDGLGFGFHEKRPQFTLEQVRTIVKAGNGDGVTSIIGNCGYTVEQGEEQLKKGFADLIAFGRPFLNDADFPLKTKEGKELSPALPFNLFY